ncbi:MAG: metalloregulator ArsR/SmtB family transcription factor [Candidatus Magasanikbacteria bacterium]|nr:metalloregulator ArsR/SmtB family transcription factor [Candidatus Magasanikbacteria bacterium]
MKKTATSIKNNSHLEVLARQFLLVGDYTRLKILCTIFNNNGACVSEITDTLRSNIAIISHHLQILHNAELLTTKRDGKKICYSLSKEPFLIDLKRLICKYNNLKNS